MDDQMKDAVLQLLKDRLCISIQEKYYHGSEYHDLIVVLSLVDGEGNEEEISRDSISVLDEE